MKTIASPSSLIRYVVMKELISIVIAILGLALFALAGLGFKGAASQFSKVYHEWQNQRTANVIELPRTYVYSGGTVKTFVPSRNEEEIELPSVVIQSSQSCEDEN